jgi:predicted MFS family arabinose efflux permease
MSRAIRKTEIATRWGVVVIAMLAAVIAAGHVGKLPPALPGIRAELGLDIVAAGWLASIFSATGMMSAIVFGAVASRLNPWRTAITGLVLLTASGLGGALAASSAQLFVSRFLEGLGFLAVVVAAPSLIASATSGRERGMALGFFAAYMPAGVSIMIFAAPAALYLGGWRLLWIAVASLAATGALLMAAIGRTQGIPSQARAVPWSTIGQALAQPGPWLMAGCFALYGAQLYALITWMPTFMIEERGADPAVASALTALIVVANGICSFFGGWLLHRGAAPWAMIVVAGAAMAISAFTAFSGAMPDAVRYLASLTLCGAGGVAAAASFASAPLFAATPAQTGVLNGLIVQASNLAQFAGPTALATGVSRSGRWESALWVMVGVNVLMMALALLVRRQEKLVVV